MNRDMDALGRPLPPVSDVERQVKVVMKHLESAIMAALAWDPWYLSGFVAILLLPVTLALWLCLRSHSLPDEDETLLESPADGKRFRRRDKIAFMGRRVFRNAKAVGSLIRGGQGKKRKAVAKLVRKVFHRESPTGSVKGDVSARAELPEAYLEEEEDQLPPAILLVMNNLRVFGHFDNKIFVELMKSIEYITVKSNHYLFRVGDPDCCMYIVESGRLNLFSQNQADTSPNSSTLLKTVGPGEPILSLLSFLTHMGSREEKFRTVTAKATEETRIIKFQFKSFKQVFEMFPDQLNKVVQVVMVRLQRVTLLALHQYLGLGAELLTQNNRGNDGKDVTDVPLTFINCAKEIPEMGRAHLKSLALDVYKEILDLTEENWEDVEATVGYSMSDYVDVSSWEPSDNLVIEETNDDPALFLVLKGVVGLTQINAEDDANVEIHRSYGGGYFGQLQVLTDEPSFFTATALECQDAHETVVARLEARFVRRLMHHYPRVAVQLANTVIDQLSPYVRSIDFSLEWLQLQSGKALYKQGQPADSTYVVLSGRLRSVIKKGSKRELVGEYARGDLAGIVETLMKTSRSTTVMAVRDTEGKSQLFEKYKYFTWQTPVF